VASKTSASSRSVSKKSRPKIGTKSKVIKFHQYLGPKNLQQQLEPCASSSASTGDTPFNILVQQQQMLLRWQLEFQQKNMQFLLSMPSNEPTNPSPPSLAVSTPGPQPTSANVGVKSSASVAAVSPALAAKRNRLEEMKVPELRDECRRLNLPRSGQKSLLIDRLLPYADDILSNATASSETKSPEQTATSNMSTPPLAASENDSSATPNVMFTVPQPVRMLSAENGISAAVPSNTSAVPMDVDTVSCKQEPKTPDLAQPNPNIYPMMLLPGSSGENVVQASVSSAVPPLIMYRPIAQPVMAPAAPTAEQIASMPSSLQEQILLAQQQHISELEHHLKLSQQELVRAQQEAQLQRILCGDAAVWMNSATLNGSSVPAVSSRPHEFAMPQLHRTNRFLRACYIVLLKTRI